MASQLTVLGPGARRHVAKVTPGTYLNDVLRDSCAKFRLDPAQYALKHRTKTVDLSLTVRLAGLVSGAKLELTQVSRSPSVVSVALQLPDGTRLLDKFPSSTSLWLILRKFEAGAAGKGGAVTGSAPGSTATAGQNTEQKNFTARGVPRTSPDSTSSGRLCHEAPVLQIMGRDYSSFVDLQKNLTQLGFNDGSVLLKLSFAVSNEPLEDAMARIATYFESVEQPAAESAPAPTAKTTVEQPAARLGEETSKHTPSEPEQQSVTAQPAPAQEATAAPAETSEVASAAAADTELRIHRARAPSSAGGMAERATIVYGAPSDGTPQAARVAHDAADYVPSVEHAKAHQAYLNRAGQNKRLATDAELAAERATAVQRLAETAQVTMKIRFSDASSVVTSFGPADTATDLYAHVRSMLAHPDEPFDLKLAGLGGGSQKPIPTGSERLIGDLGFTGRVMLSLVWGPQASPATQSAPCLSKEVLDNQRQFRLQEVEAPADNEVVGSAVKETKTEDGKEKKKDGVPKWLKLGRK